MQNLTKKQNEYIKKYANEECQILHGDVIVALSKIEDSSIDLIFIDPPYNIGKNFNGKKDKWDTYENYLKWSYKWLDLSISKLKSNGSIYVMTSTQFMPYFDIYLGEKVKILSRIIWYYDSSGVQAKKYYGSLYELILFCVKNKNCYIFNAKDILVEAKTGSQRKLIDHIKTPPKVYNSTKVPGNVWEFPRVRYLMNEYENHPTKKPIALLERIIKTDVKLHILFNSAYKLNYSLKLLIIFELSVFMYLHISTFKFFY